jgi:hypothetical protein
MLFFATDLQHPLTTYAVVREVPINISNLNGSGYLCIRFDSLEVVIKGRGDLAKKDLCLDYTVASFLQTILYRQVFVPYSSNFNYLNADIALEYNGKQRKIYKILQLRDDGLICEQSNTDIRYFKFDKMDIEFKFDKIEIKM